MFACRSSGELFETLPLTCQSDACLQSWQNNEESRQRFEKSLALTAWMHGDENTKHSCNTLNRKNECHKHHSRLMTTPCLLSIPCIFKKLAVMFGTLSLDFQRDRHSNSLRRCSTVLWSPQIVRLGSAKFRFRSGSKNMDRCRAHLSLGF